jgi:hypothetical protein
MVKMEITYKFQSEFLKGRHRMGDQGVVGIILLKWIVQKQEVRVCTKFNGLRTDVTSGHL